MTKEETNQKFTALEEGVTGLQQAVRSNHEQGTQTLSLLGQMRQELIMEQSHIKRLQLEMEKVYTYINEGKLR